MGGNIEYIGRGDIMRLGPIHLRDFEIPSGVNFGGRQSTAVHKLSGGRRVVDALGPDSASIKFSGAFSGQDALYRAQSLDSLRSSGTQVELSWDNFLYRVIISEFSAIYQTRGWIPYQVTCTVAQDRSEQQNSPSAIQTDGLTIAMLSAAASLMQDSSATRQLGIRLALPGDGLSNPSRTATSTAYIAQARAEIDVRVAGAESLLTAAALFQDQLPSLAIASLSSAEISAETMCTLTSVRCYLIASGTLAGVISYA